MNRDVKKVTDEIKETLKKSKVYHRSITKELETSFIDYSMSVITSRALPDVRDGLKPVHRRILYAAYNLGMTSDKPYKKSARLVGEVIGKYHPHGDSAVYEASVRMAQDFSLRYPLIDGHGNFGSIDGDSAAAMRYTEQRLSKISNELLRNIEKNTIDFSENYDGSEKEPTILPASFPNLLANGSTGIAVGMSTVIPPHNLTELIDAAIHLANNPNASIKDLMNYLKGPDFPTSAEIVGTTGIISYFNTGKGSVTVRSKYVIKNHENNKSTIIITELPYMVTKSSLIERIVRLVRDEVIEGIADLRDETSREGIRIVIETKRDVIPEILLNKLFKHTELQTNISVNIIALVNGVPRQLNIKQCLKCFIEHQINVLVRKSKFELRKAEEREHILLGLFVAISNIEEVIKIIRNSDTNENAEKELISKFALSKKQAKAILEMRLRSLSGLERNKIEEELKQLKTIIANLKEILSSRERQIKIICSNMTEIKNKYGDERRTEILEGVSSSIKDEDLIPKEDIVITLSKNGYLKRIPLSTYHVQNRGGVGVKGLSVHSDDDVKLLITTTTHIDLLLFTNKGKVYRIRAHEIPPGSRQSKGMPALNLINIEKDENVLTILPIDSYKDGYLFFVTLKGIVKKTKLEEFDSIRITGKIAISLRENDSLFNVFKTTGDDDILLGSSSGYVCRFKESNVNPMGRTARGVKGIKLVSNKDHVVGASPSSFGSVLLSISEKGKGKITNLEEYSYRNRGARGLFAIKINQQTGKMIFSQVVNGDENLLLLTSEGKIIRISLKNFSSKGRTTMGNKLISMGPNVELKSVSVFKEDETENGDTNSINEELSIQEEE